MIHIAPSHVGELHREMGYSPDQRIPTSALHAAEAHASPKKEKQLVFAENARKWNHTGGSKLRSRLKSLNK